MSINDGGPAFPVAEDHKVAADLEWTCGLTLRDYFAAKAMQALIEKTDLLIRAVLNDGAHHGTPEEMMALHKAGICESAYSYADAMLAAREGK